MTVSERVAIALLFAIAMLLILLASRTHALADGMIYPPPPVYYGPPPPWYPTPRTIVRDGQYFNCPTPWYDPYCALPNDYSWNLRGPPWRRRPQPPSQFDPHVPYGAMTAPPPPPEFQ